MPYTTMPLPEARAASTSRTAREIRAWIIAELARSLNVDATTINAAAPVETLGVDSLAAIGMTGALSAWLGRDLPATLMWEHPTLDSLVDALSAGAGKVERPNWPGLVNLQSQGDRVPLFCFPGRGGHPAIFSHLASELRPPHPCYGLVVPGYNGEQVPFGRVEEIAAAMLSSIRRVQSSGPYQLAGYSFGGLLAFETARQLTDAGENVSLLAIYDTFTVGGRVLRPRWERLALHAWLIASRRGHVQYIHNRLKRARARKARAARQAPASSHPTAPSQFGAEAVWLADHQASLDYQPRSYPGSILLFRASERAVDSRFYRMDATNGWGAFAGAGVCIVPVPGNHGNLLDADHAPIAAEMLRPYLSQQVAG
jgi:thioesterase domain-containing protein/acyl carrier protein